MRLAYSRQIFEKCSNVKFNEIRSVGTEVLHAARQTDGQRGKRHDESNSRFLQFCELDLSRNKILIYFL